MLRYVKNFRVRRGLLGHLSLRCLRMTRLEGMQSIVYRAVLRYMKNFRVRRGGVIGSFVIALFTDDPAGRDVEHCLQSSVKVCEEL